MALTPVTPFLGLKKPRFNSSPWHDEVNDNFTIIDTAIAGQSERIDTTVAAAEAAVAGAEAALIVAQEAVEVATEAVDLITVTTPIILAAEDAAQIAAAEAAVHAQAAFEISTGVALVDDLETAQEGINDSQAMTSLRTKQAFQFLADEISAASFIQAGDGDDLYPALTRAVTAIKAGGPRTLRIPHKAGGRFVSQQVLFDLSNFALILECEVTQTGTTPQRALLFAYDTNEEPAEYLENVFVFGNGHTVDGNGSEISYEYGGPDSQNYAAVYFNKIKGLSIFGLNATNGLVDCLAVRKCQNWLVRDGVFSFAKEDNGFSATTDLTPWVSGDIETWGYGKVQNCVAFGCKDFGLTAYNVSGVWFENCRSFENDSGFSYEDSPSVPNTKDYRGGFLSCKAYNNVTRGWLVDADDVMLDDFCESYNNRGTLRDNTDHIYENGVIIANVNRAYVGGKHKKNGRAGVALFNGSGQAMEVTVSGEISDNDFNGIYGRGVGELIVKQGTSIKRNGLVLVAGSYGSGINVSNSGGANNLEDEGLIDVTGVLFSGNGLGAIRTDYVKRVIAQDNKAFDDAASASAIAIRIARATDAVVTNNILMSSTGLQTFAVSIENTVTNSYEWGNIGTGTSGIIANAATGKRQSMRGQMIASATWDPGSVAADSGVVTTVAVLGAEVGDFAEVSFTQDIGRLVPYAVVASSGDVNVYLRNFTPAAIDPTSGTVRVVVTKRNGG